MANAITRAMRLLEAGRCDDAATALAPLVGPSGDGVIARFRHAEALSRIGRHDEAALEATKALADAPATPATALWLAWTLAEAGRHADAAQVNYPKGHEEFTDVVRDGFSALAKLAADVPDGRDEVLRTIMASRHSPILSLALRIAETHRLRSARRAPDPLSVWSAHVARLDLAEDGIKDVPPPPAIADPSAPTKSEIRAATKWLRAYGAFSCEPRLIEALRAATSPPQDVDVLEAEMLLAACRTDDVRALVDGLCRTTDAKEAGAELCVTACRVAHIDGRAARPSEFPGYDDARSRAGTDITWLEVCAAILDHRPLDSRRSADMLADPSHAEYVEAAVLRWSVAGIEGTPQTPPGPSAAK